MPEEVGNEVETKKDSSEEIGCIKDYVLDGIRLSDFKFFCVVCLDGFNDLEEFRSHRQADEHTFMYSKKVVKLVPGMGFCQACGTTIASTWANHRNTVKHRMCVNSLKAIGDVDTVYDLPLGCKVAGTLGDPMQDPDNEIDKELAKKNGLQYGSPHVKGVKGVPPLVGLQYIRQKSGNLDEFTKYRCSFCELVFGYKVRYEHLNSKQHRNGYIKHRYPEFYEELHKIPDNRKMRKANRALFLCSKIESLEQDKEDENAKKIRNEFETDPPKPITMKDKEERSRFPHHTMGSRQPIELRPPMEPGRPMGSRQRIRHMQFTGPRQHMAPVRDGPMRFRGRPFPSMRCGPMGSPAFPVRGYPMDHMRKGDMDPMHGGNIAPMRSMFSRRDEQFEPIGRHPISSLRVGPFRNDPSEEYPEPMRVSGSVMRSKPGYIDQRCIQRGAPRITREEEQLWEERDHNHDHHRYNKRPVQYEHHQPNKRVLRGEDDRVAMDALSVLERYAIKKAEEQVKNKMVKMRQALSNNVDITHTPEFADLTAQIEPPHPNFTNMVMPMRGDERYMRRGGRF